MAEAAVGFVGRVVRAEVLVHVAVGPVLRAHVVEVVRGLELAPGVDKAGVFRRLHGLLDVVDRLERRVLDGVALPGRKVSFGVGPRDRRVYVVGRVFGVPFLHDLAGRAGADAAGGELVGERREELEDARVGPLVLAEGFVVHEEVHAVARGVGNPVGVGVGVQRVAGPVFIREAEGDVVAEFVVLQEHIDRAGCFGMGAVLRDDGFCRARQAEGRRAVGDVRRAAGEVAVRAFGHDAFESHEAGDLGDLVVEDELGVAEDGRRLAEEFLDHARMFRDLFAEFAERFDGTERVVVRLGEEFDLARFGQLLE